MKIKKIKRGYIIFSTILLTLIISFFIDKVFILYMSYLRNTVLDYFFIFIYIFSNAFIVTLFLLTLMSYKKENNKYIITLLSSIAISAIVSFLLKILIRRERPFIDGTVDVLVISFNYIKDSFYTWNFSFPCFIAVFLFSTIPIINKTHKKFNLYWIIFCILAVISPIYFGTNYLSDVLFGAVIGYLIGYLMVKLIK